MSKHQQYQDSQRCWEDGLAWWTELSETEIHDLFINSPEYVDRFEAWCEGF